MIFCFRTPTKAKVVNKREKAWNKIILFFAEFTKLL